jgi:prevent-host-death family protein
MTMKMPVTKFKAKCTQILREVATKPYTVEVTNRGKVIAVVSPPKPKPKKDPTKYFGSLAGTASYVGDIVAPAVKEKDWEACR